MSVTLPEQKRRAALNLCIWCAEPARYIPHLHRHGVHCPKHARIIAANYKCWSATRHIPKPKKYRAILVPRDFAYH